jgi:hypothetical protein
MSVKKLKEQVHAMTRVIQQLINEINNTKDLSIGTLEVVKLMPDYDKALKDLKDNYEKQKPPKLELDDDKS